MYPFAEQVFAYKAADRERCAGTLVLEVKGDFCYKVEARLKATDWDRPPDYLAIVDRRARPLITPYFTITGACQ
jgi:hypothetical protein